MSEQSFEPKNETRPAGDEAHGTHLTVPGTLLRGADGHLYFIPDQELQPFRVPDHAQAPLEECFATELASNIVRVRGGEGWCNYHNYGPE